MTINIFCRGCQCSFLSSIAEAFTNSVAGSEINFPIFKKIENAKNVYV